MTEKETIVTKMYDLIKYLIPIVNRFPRDFKYTLGDRISNLVLDLLERYVEAYYSGNRQAKMNLLIQNNLKLERLRFLIRLAHDYRLFSNQRFGYICAKTDEVGKMNGGWIKQLQKNK